MPPGTFARLHYTPLDTLHALSGTLAFLAYTWSAMSHYITPHYRIGNAITLGECTAWVTALITLPLSKLVECYTRSAWPVPGSVHAAAALSTAPGPSPSSGAAAWLSGNIHMEAPTRGISEGF